MTRDTFARAASVLLLLLILLLAFCLTGCQHAAWTCMAQPTLGPDAKAVVTGFEVRCSRRF